jgi:hypothetical protein
VEVDRGDILKNTILKNTILKNTAGSSDWQAGTLSIGASSANSR